MCQKAHQIKKIGKQRKIKMTFLTQSNRIESVRQLMADHGLDALLIPRSDDFQGENVPENAERLAWLTGFDGSVGMALVTRDQAMIFVDGRYHLQVKQQVDTVLFTPCDSKDPGWQEGVKQCLPQGGRIGYDPWLHTLDWLDRQQRIFKDIPLEWVPLDRNIIDLAWHDRPSPPDQPAMFYPLCFAGKTVGDKISVLRGRLAQTGAALLITQPEHLAWLLNLRGGDVPYTPVMLARALLAPDGTITVFADPHRVPDQVLVDIAAQYPGGNIVVSPPETLASILTAVTGGICYDPARTPAMMGCFIKQPLPLPSPIESLKAVQNPIELRGMKAAHCRDAVAMIRFLSWLDRAAQNLDNEPQSEISVAEKLLWFRQQQENFVQPSFATIAGFAGHGAIVHYRATPATDSRLTTGELLLIDSGGQYWDGTTDITRTVPIGPPTPTMAYHYTLVLRGHIALGEAVFPPGTMGSQLDVLARLPLWQNGLDYDHGTGHGVGCFLGVHDGPQRISKAAGSVSLEPGMGLSNEPGYYLADHFGIRIENLVIVSETPVLHETSGQSMFGFENLTLVPYCRDLILPSFLCEREKRVINHYHTTIFDQIADLLDEQDRQWLERATAPI